MYTVYYNNNLFEYVNRSSPSFCSIRQCPSPLERSHRSAEDDFMASASSRLCSCSPASTASTSPKVCRTIQPAMREAHGEKNCNFNNSGSLVVVIRKAVVRDNKMSSAVTCMTNPAKRSALCPNLSTVNVLTKTITNWSAAWILRWTKPDLIPYYKSASGPSSRNSSREPTYIQDSDRHVLHVWSEP